MATQIPQAVPAYKTQWDPEAKVIQRSTGMNRMTTDLCISYLFSNTVFRSPREFVSYFQEKESLDIPAGQPLEIWDISVLHHEGEAPVAWMENEQPGLNILSRLVAPLAKGIGISVPDKATLSWVLNRGLACTPTKTVTLVVHKMHINTRLSDLFRLMVMCRVPRVEFRDNQKLQVWGVTEAEQTSIFANPDSLTDLFQRTCPNGCSVGFNPADLQKISYQGTNCVAIAMSGPQFTVSIQDNYQFGSVMAFIKRLELGELIVPPHQKLVVSCKYVGALIKAFERLSKQHEFAFHLAVDHGLLAPYGYRLEKVFYDGVDGEINCSLRFQENTLEMTSRRGFACKLAEKTLFIDLEMLGDSMIAEGRSSLTLAPHQKLALCGLTDREAAEMAGLTTDLEKYKLALQRVLARGNPIGFSWTLTIGEGEIKLGSGAFKGDAGPKYCTVRSELGMELKLVRPDGPTMIASIVNHSHPELLRDLQAATPNAMKFLLFRAFYYYLCGNCRVFRSNEFPNFFKPEKVRELVPAENGRMQTEGVDPVIIIRNGAVCQILDESTVTRIRQKMGHLGIQEAIAKDNLDQACLRKWVEILQMSPDEFDRLAIDKYPATVQYLLKAILELVTKELQDSPFITTHLQAYLNSLPPEDSSQDRKDST